MDSYFYSTIIPTFPGRADLALDDCDSSALIISIVQLNSFSRNDFALSMVWYSSSCEVINEGSFAGSLTIDWTSLLMSLLFSVRFGCARTFFMISPMLWVTESSLCRMVENS